MIPWIQVYSNLIKHPKTYALADELKLSSKDTSPNAVAAGMLVSLWLWAAQNATDGDLSKCTARAIAEAAEYKKNPVSFVSALVKTKWLDEDKKLHNWDEYATLLIDCEQQSREKTRERVKRHREKKKSSGNSGVTPDCNATCNVTDDGKNVTDTPCNAPTIPNHTIPNLTNICGGDGGESAGAREAAESGLERIGLKPGEYPNVTVSLVENVERLTDILIQHHAGRRYAPLDCRNVFIHVFRWADGGYILDKDAFSLLEYAFEQAAISGFKGQWRYISGIMTRLAARDIHTRAEAEAFDAERPDKEATP